MMKNKKLVKEIEGELRKNENRFNVLGFILATTSIFKGTFILHHEGFFLNYVEPYLKNLPENLIGSLILIAGIIKLIGVVTRNKQLKRYGIWLLCFFWWFQFGLAFSYSFGTGYPHDSWIYTFCIASICIYEAKKGVFY